MSSDHDPSKWYSKIEDNLYLGMIETVHDPELIKKIGIKKVLTLREFPIDEDKRVADVEYQHVGIHDTPNDDILTHFPECHKFIEDGQTKGQTVYVHCRLGISRSATVVTGYLMAKYKLKSDEALKKVQKQRKVIQPNPSFVAQLKLWGDMEYKFDPLNQEFRQHLLKRWIFAMKLKVQNSGNTTDPDMTILEKFFTLLELPEDKEGKTSSCKNCKTVLFRELHIVKDRSLDKPRYQCQSVVTEPQKWMQDQVDKGPVGFLNCPKCKNKVGDYNWNQFFCECVIHTNIKAYQVLRFMSADLK